MGAMKTAIACLVLVAACHKADHHAGAKITPEYKEDIANLCDVLRLSGADQLPEGNRLPTIAMWLGPHITTPAGHTENLTFRDISSDGLAGAVITVVDRKSVV